MPQRHVHTRRVPIDNAADVRIAPPRKIALGGDGWAGAELVIDAVTDADTFSLDTTPIWSEFESTAFTKDDRINGLRIRHIPSNSLSTIIDYTGATGNIEIEPGFLVTPVVGQRVRIEAELPLLCSSLMIYNHSGQEFRYNTEDNADLIAGGQYSIIPNGMSRLLLDNKVMGSRSPIIRCRLDAASATPVELEITAS